MTSTVYMNQTQYQQSSNDHHHHSPSHHRPSFTRTSKLTFSRSWLVHVAEETLDIAEHGSYTSADGRNINVEQDVRHSVENSVHYHCSHLFPLPEKEWTRRFDTTFHVCYGSSLDIAAQLKDVTMDHNAQQIGILNSASAKTPSKFARGTISQEECLCRASLLYPCLAQFESKPHHFYSINNKQKYQKSSSACAIFSPLVPVIRQDTVAGELLDAYHKYSIVSICAPNAFVFGTREEEKEKYRDMRLHCVPKAAMPGTNQQEDDYEKITLQEAIHDRVFRALSMFVEHRCIDLVLCAFGCGVHGNNPEIVANLFRDMLSNEFEGCFRTVVFAIQVNRIANYDAFESAFHNKPGFVPCDDDTATTDKCSFHHSESFNAGACCDSFVLARKLEKHIAEK